MQKRSVPIKARVFGVTVLLAMCMTTYAHGAETTKLRVTFRPYRLGVETTIESSFDIATNNGQLPSPPTKFALRFPASLDFSTSNLGLSICHPRALEAGGVAACSPNAQIGRGHAVVEVPIGPTPIVERTKVTALMGPPHNEQVGVLIFSEASTPVQGDVLFEGELLEGNGAFGELLETSVPLVPTVPGASDVLVSKIELSIDPRGLRYYKRVKGVKVSYHPRGFELPRRCPSGGFQFSLAMQFADGTDVPTHYRIPCPTRLHRKHARL
jgi:hypothetical protein